MRSVFSRRDRFSHLSDDRSYSVSSLGPGVPKSAATVRTRGNPDRPTKLKSGLLFLATAFVAWIMTGLILFVPATTIPRQADSLLVLAPARDRMLFAQGLMDEGIAETLAISVPRGYEAPLDGICNGSFPYKVICFAPVSVMVEK